MALRNVVKMGDPVLNKRSKDVVKFDEKLHILLDDMAETMYANDGVGLAAPQVGILRRAVLVDVGDGLLELINPVILEESGEQIDVEGCLSVEDYVGEVKRPMNIKLRAQDRNGKVFEFKARGFFARACCHEIDHLEGVLFVEKVVGKEN